MKKVKKSAKFFTLYGYTKGMKERCENIRTTMCSAMDKSDSWGEPFDDCKRALELIGEVEFLLSKTKDIVESEYQRELKKRKKNDY